MSDQAFEAEVLPILSQTTPPTPASARPRSLAEADTGFLKSNLQCPDQLDFGTSIEWAIQQLKPPHHSNPHTRPLRKDFLRPF